MVRVLGAKEPLEMSYPPRVQMEGLYHPGCAANVGACSGKVGELLASFEQGRKGMIDIWKGSLTLG